MGVIFDLFDQIQVLQIRQHGLAAFEAVHARIFVTRGQGHLGVEANDGDALQIQALACRVIVGIVGGREFHATSAKFGIHKGIGHHRDFTVREGQLDGFAEQVLVALILGMHGHAGIAEHRFGARGGHHQVPAAIGKGISQVPELALFFHVFHFEIR